MEYPLSLSSPHLRAHYPEAFSGRYDANEAWTKICEDELLRLLDPGKTDIQFIFELTDALKRDPGLGIQSMDPITAAGTWVTHHRATGKSLVTVGKSSKAG